MSSQEAETNFRAQTEGWDLILEEAEVEKQWGRTGEARARMKGHRRGAVLVRVLMGSEFGRCGEWCWCSGQKFEPNQEGLRALLPSEPLFFYKSKKNIFLIRLLGKLEEINSFHTPGIYRVPVNESCCSSLLFVFMIIILIITGIQNHDHPGRMKSSSCLAVRFPFPECMPVFPSSYPLSPLTASTLPMSVHDSRLPMPVCHCLPYSTLRRLLATTGSQDPSEDTGTVAFGGEDIQTV